MPASGQCAHHERIRARSVVAAEVPPGTMGCLAGCWHCGPLRQAHGPPGATGQATGNTGQPRAAYVSAAAREGRVFSSHRRGVAIWLFVGRCRHALTARAALSLGASQFSHPPRVDLQEMCDCADV